MGRHCVGRGMSRAVLVCVLSVLAACTSAPKKKDDTAAKAAAQHEMDEKVASADKAIKAGQTDHALSLLDAAAKADPAAKQPWLKKAQIHFEARQYGAAISEAQEVIQRDVHDLTAQSILAVSGLRVSATALAQLRKANEVTGSTREEAESVAKTIREALGEPVLVPPVAAASSAEAASRTVASTGKSTSQNGIRAGAARPAAPRPINSTGGGIAPTATPIVKAPVAAGSAGSSNGRLDPFGALK